MKRTRTPAGEAATFFALTIGVTWILWIPLAALGIPAGNFAAQERGPAWVLVPFLLGGFMPSIVGLVLTGVREGKAGLRSIWRRLVHVRIGWRWYLVAVGLVILPTAGQVLIHRLLGGRFDLPLFFWAGTSQHELALPFAGFLCGVTAISLLMTWLHNNTGGSIWTAVFFHWIYTYAATVVATGVTRSTVYNWLEYAPFVAAALVVLAITGLRKREPRG